MGVLSITPRSVKLQNLGNVQSVNFNNGAAEAHKSASRVGDAVVGLGGKVADLGLELHQRDQKTRFNNFMTELQSQTNKAMLGDGKDIKGLMNEDFSDTKDWTERVEKERERIIANARKNNKISDGEWNEYVNNMSFGFREQWNNRVAAKAFEVSDKNSQAAAKARLTTVESTLALGDGNELMYNDWMRAVNEDIEKSHITDPTVAAAKRREAGLRLVDTQYKNRLMIAASKAAHLEDPKEVRNIFEKEFASMVKEDGTYDFSSIIKHKIVADSLGAEKLSGYEKIYEAQYKKTLKAAEQAAQILRRQKQYDVVNEATNAQTAMILGEGDFGKDWDTLEPSEKASRYEDWLNSSSGISDGNGKDLTWEESLKKYAPDRAARVASTINTLKKQAKSADAKVNKEQNKNESAMLSNKLSQPFMPMTDSTGKVKYDPSGNVMVRELTPLSRMDAALKYYEQGRINEGDMAKIAKANRTAFSDGMKALWKDAFNELGIKAPKAVEYNMREGEMFGEFKFSPTKEVLEDTEMALDDHHNYTGDWSWYRFDAENVYYNQVIDALNLTQDWMRSKPERTFEDGKKYFKNILSGRDAEGVYVKMKMQEHLAHERKFINALEYNYLLRRPKNINLGATMPTTTDDETNED